MGYLNLDLGMYIFFFAGEQKINNKLFKTNTSKSVWKFKGLIPTINFLPMRSFILFLNRL